jgi:hypothetical protein
MGLGMLHWVAYLVRTALLPTVVTFNLSVSKSLHTCFSFARPQS